MKIDLSNCDIRTPTGDERLPLYRLLTDIFPSDGPLVDELIEDEELFPVWPAYTLCLGSEVLGNVSLAPMRVRLDGRTIALAGIAWVVTREDCRRQGIARHLLKHVLEILDAEGLPAVLFTGFPGVYEPLGFEIVEQTYLAAQSGELGFERSRVETKILRTLTPELVDGLARLRDGIDDRQEGQVIRDGKYWQFYRALFNGNPDVNMVLYEEEGGAEGYVRIEIEEDRLLVSELCCPAGSDRMVEALLDGVASLARAAEREIITVALPDGHPAMRVLRKSGVELEPEPPGARRETFMVRVPENQTLGALATLQWPLSDKF